MPERARGVEYYGIADYLIDASKQGQCLTTSELCISPHYYGRVAYTDICTNHQVLMTTAAMFRVLSQPSQSSIAHCALPRPTREPPIAHDDRPSSRTH